MRQVSPAGDVYQAGTLSGNPLAMAAGLATLSRLRDASAYERLEDAGALLERELFDAIERHSGQLSFARVGSMFTLFFNGRPVTSWDDAAQCDTGRHAAWFHELLARGIYLPPSQFEACFISLAHTDDELRTTARAMGDALDAVLAD